MADDEITDDEIADALEAILECDAELGDVLCVVHASLERDEDLAPKVLQTAVMGKYQVERDFANGGADQFVWNNGSDIAREIGEAWRAVGAVENGELLVWLADELDALSTEVSDDDIAGEPVRWFMAYRTRVGGPEFGIPDPDTELAEALVEWAIEHADEMC
jgi:hypothetical protein